MVTLGEKGLGQWPRVSGVGEDFARQECQGEHQQNSSDIAVSVHGFLPHDDPAEHCTCHANKIQHEGQ